MLLQFYKKKKESWGEKFFEEVMVENFPNLMKDRRHKPTGSRSLVNSLKKSVNWISPKKLMLR